MKNSPAIVRLKTNNDTSSKILFGLTNKGEITPAENQVTAIFPDTSDALSN